MIRPNMSGKVMLPAGENHVFALPKGYQSANVSGVPTFYKDDYTDLRGKFDYASLSTGDLDGTTRFSVLIMSNQHGATVKEVQPPKR